MLLTKIIILYSKKINLISLLSSKNNIENTINSLNYSYNCKIIILLA